MITYKGFKIPDSLDDCVKQAATSTDMGIPQLRAINDKKGMRITLPITIEEIINHPEELSDVVEMCKKYIDACPGVDSE